MIFVERQRVMELLWLVSKGDDFVLPGRKTACEFSRVLRVEVRSHLF